MIKVNLHQRKVAVGVAALGDGAAKLKGLAGLLEKLRGGEGQKSTMILGGVYLALLIVIWWIAASGKEKKMQELSDQIAVVDSKISLLNSELNKTQGYEITKRNLEADEKKIRNKIETIQELIRDRSTPPKILMSLSEAIPKEVWLSDFALKDRAFSIKGLSNNMDLVSDFIRSLSETFYFKDVQLKGSRAAPDAKGKEVTNFELEAQRR